MKAKGCFSFLLITIFIFTFMPSVISAAESSFGVIERSDSYMSVNNRQVIGDGVRVFFETVSDTERITIEIDEHVTYSKQYIASINCLEYKYEGSRGEPFSISTAGSFNGIHYDRIIVKRLADGSTVTVSVFLKSTAAYEFDDTSDSERIILRYNTQYKEFLDKKLLEKQQAEALFLSTVPEWFKSGISSGENASGSELKAEYILDEHVATLKIPGLILVDSMGRPLYEARYINTSKYLIRFDTAKGNVNVEQIQTNDYLVKKVSISMDKTTMKTTIVIESEGLLYFKRNTSNEKTDFELNMSARPFTGIEDSQQIQEPLGDDGQDDLGGIGEHDTRIGTAVSDLAVSYTNKFTYDEIAIDLTNSTSYRIHRLSEPERVVIDIKGIDLKTYFKQIELNSTYIEKIRYAHFDSNTARVVLDLKNPAGYSDSFSPQNNYTYEEKNGKLYIKVERRIFDRYYYSNMSDRVYLLMIGEYLTSGEYDLQQNSLYSSSYDTVSGIYTISYKSSYNYNGRMNINDSYISYIDISTTGGTATMRIRFNNRSIVPLPITRYLKSGSNYQYWHSTISFLIPKQQNERLIVIDPGHGGTDPGAVANGLRESELNLDIAKRLKNLLAGTNIRVYMTRGDDSYVGLGERTAVANMMDADLFLSIHNNAYYAASTGTETFYYTQPQVRNSVSAGDFANILQKHMLADLGLYSRGVKQNTFSVLRYAKMPSALVEIAFLTNINDSAKLKDPVFRQKAAEALFKAINETFSKMK